MIFSNHEFDKDQSYHDFLVAIHTKDLNAEFAQLGQSLQSLNVEDKAEAQDGSKGK